MVSKLFLSAAALGLLAGAFAQKPIVPTAVQGVKIEPVRFAKARIVNGRAVKAGPWIKVQQTPTINSPGFVSYDASEVDSAGNPVNDRWGNPVTDLAAGSRWFFGTAYQNSFAVNDMTVAPGYAGRTTEIDAFSFYWGTDTSGGDVQCYVALFTAEDFGETDAGSGGTDPGFDNAYDGIIWDFGVQTKNSGFFFAAVGNLTGSGLFHQMPMDGRGATLMILGEAIDPDTGAITISSGQPMLWGTDRLDGSSTNPSFQNEFQWDDDNPVDAMHTAPDEFYSYAFGLQTDPLGAMTSYFSNQAVLRANTATVSFGSNQTGTVLDTHESDNVYFTNDRGIVPNFALDPPTIVWGLGGADLLGETFVQIDILSEAKANKGGIRQIIELRDQAAEAWVVLGSTTENLSNGTDTVKTRTVTGAAVMAAIETDGTVEVRTRYRPTLPLANPAYTVSNDQIEVVLTR
ncbi:MAG: hypothetical protein WAO58_13075 [Fimbriimonadaceae bacterium]